MRLLACSLLLLLISLGPGAAGMGAGSNPPFDSPASPRYELEECWSNPPLPGGGGINSEIVAALGIDTEAADDFIMDETRGIARARWWGRYYGVGGPAVTAFNIRVYADDECTPGELLEETIIPDNAGETLYNGIYWYAVDFPFLAHGQERYWMSIRACHEIWPPSWVRIRGSSISGCNAVWRGAYYSYPDWVEIEQVLGYQIDLALDMSCNPIVSIDHTFLDATEHANEPIPVVAAITAYGIALDPSAIWIEYRVDPSLEWTREPMTYQGGGEWLAHIGGQPQPSTISYYIHAENIHGGTGELPVGGRDNPRQFDVAWKVDLFEEESGWIVDPDRDDDAEEGIWERGEPEATFAQPPSDHSSGGSLCWITGAAAGGSAYANDVDGGKTTLQSPPYDLAGVEQARLKYWRWYTNHLGWLIDGSLAVQARNDGGPWVDIENPALSVNDWVLVETNLHGLFEGPLGEVELRFTVSDEWNDSLTEAAIDDLEILAERLVAVPENAVDPGLKVISLAGGLPNPFRAGTMIEFFLSSETMVALSIYNTQGQRVRGLLYNSRCSIGRTLVYWDGTNDEGHPVQSGIYFIRFEAEGKRQARSVTLVR